MAKALLDTVLGKLTEPTTLPHMMILEEYEGYRLSNTREYEPLYACAGECCR